MLNKFQLKYSNVHGQLRALTILKALVENCGPRFQSNSTIFLFKIPHINLLTSLLLLLLALPLVATFANERLVDRIKVMVADPTCDEKVKRKIMSVLSSWYRLFKDDKGMQLVAGLYSSCGGGKKVCLLLLLNVLPARTDLLREFRLSIRMLTIMNKLDILEKLVIELKERCRRERIRRKNEKD